MPRLLWACLLGAVMCGCAKETFTLRQAEVPLNRWLPHAYYDQAVASIQTLYPDHEPIVNVRIAQVGDKLVSVYAYRKKGEPNVVYVEGCVVTGTSAYVVAGSSSLASLDAQLKQTFGANSKELSNPGFQRTVPLRGPAAEPGR